VIIPPTDLLNFLVAFVQIPQVAMDRIVGSNLQNTH